MVFKRFLGRFSMGRSGKPKNRSLYYSFMMLACFCFFWFLGVFNRLILNRSLGIPSDCDESSTFRAQVVPRVEEDGIDSMGVLVVTLLKEMCD